MAVRVDLLGSDWAQPASCRMTGLEALRAPDDIRSLQQALTDRDQQLLELRRQLEERGEELAAARAANRKLMTQLNTRQ